MIEHHFRFIQNFSCFFGCPPSNILCFLKSFCVFFESSIYAKENKLGVVINKITTYVLLVLYYVSLSS